MEAKQTNGQSDPPPFALTSKPLPGERAEVSMVKTGVYADGASVWQIQQNYQMGAMKPPTDQLILEDREPREGCEIVEMLTYGSLYLVADRKTAQIQYLPGTPPRVTMSEARLAQYYWPAFIGCLRFHQMLENQSGDLITHPMPACWNSPDTTGCLDNFVNTPFVDEYVRRQHMATVVKTEPPDVEMSDALPAFLQQDDESTSGESDSSASSKDKARSTPESSVNTPSTSTTKTVPSTNVAQPLSTQPTSAVVKQSTSRTVPSRGVLPFSTHSSSTIKASTPKTVASTSVMPLAPVLPTQSTAAKQLSSPISVITSTKVPITRPSVMPPVLPTPSTSAATVAVQPVESIEPFNYLQPMSSDSWALTEQSLRSEVANEAHPLPKHSTATVTSAVQPSTSSTWPATRAVKVPMANTSTSNTVAEMDATDWNDEEIQRRLEEKAIEKLRYKERRRRRRTALALAKKGVIQLEEGEIFDVQSVAHQQSRPHRGIGPRPQRGLQFRPRGPHSLASRGVRPQPYPHTPHSPALRGVRPQPHPHTPHSPASRGVRPQPDPRPSHPPMYNQQAVEPFHAPPSFQDNSAPHDHFYAPHPQRPDHVDGCRCQPGLEAQWS